MKGRPDSHAYDVFGARTEVAYHVVNENRWFGVRPVIDIKNTDIE